MTIDQQKLNALESEVDSRIERIGRNIARLQELERVEADLLKTEPFISPVQAARLLAVNVETVRRWCKRGWIHHIQAGGRCGKLKVRNPLMSDSFLPGARIARKTVGRRSLMNLSGMRRRSRW